MEFSQAKFDEAVSYANRLKNDHKYDIGDTVFQAARALTDDSQPEEMRISNAEGYLQHSKARQDYDAYADATERPVAELVQHFDSLVRGLYKQTN
jgi:hypothetical protein